MGRGPGSARGAAAGVSPQQRAPRSRRPGTRASALLGQVGWGHPPRAPAHPLYGASVVPRTAATNSRESLKAGAGRGGAGAQGSPETPADRAGQGPGAREEAPAPGPPRAWLPAPAPTTLKRLQRARRGRLQTSLGRSPGQAPTARAALPWSQSSAHGTAGPSPAPRAPVTSAASRRHGGVGCPACPLGTEPQVLSRALGAGHLEPAWTRLVQRRVLPLADPPWPGAP